MFATESLGIVSRVEVGVAPIEHLKLGETSLAEMLQSVFSRRPIRYETKITDGSSSTRILLGAVEFDPEAFPVTTPLGSQVRASEMATILTNRILSGETQLDPRTVSSRGCRLGWSVKKGYLDGHPVAIVKPVWASPPSIR